jgi:hypothetical protein
MERKSFSDLKDALKLDEQRLKNGLTVQKRHLEAGKPGTVKSWEDS